MESNLENLTPQDQTSPTTRIIKTDVGSVDGQNKCPKCGATDISLNVNNGRLRCNFCRHEFDLEKVDELNIEVDTLEGEIIGSGATNIVADTNDVLTFKCSSCGAEVVIDTSSKTQARCHWCRNTLSINQQIPNGTIPDVVLPFKITRDVAKASIEQFVGKRKFFAHPTFKKEFTTTNVMGVYFPYMVVNVNSHAFLEGEGEKNVRRYVQNDKTYYDADVYKIEREFDLGITGITIEANKDRLNTLSTDKTNNIINAIMPFDTENCVKYDANFLKGYTSERRDTNVDQLKNIVGEQAKDIARFAANDTIKQYDRGVSWKNEQLDVKGTLWTATYLPVWLYSYQEVKNKKSILHYVAVNGRTKETMGSVPIYFPKLIGVSIGVEILGILGTIFLDFDYDWLLIFAGLVFFLLMLMRYRNFSARHKYETETKTEMKNLRVVDQYTTRKKGLQSSVISNKNNTSIHAPTGVDQVLDTALKNIPITGMIKESMDKNIQDKM